MAKIKFKRRIIRSRNVLIDFTKNFEFKFTGRWMFYSLIIGLVAGGGGILFFYLQEAIELISLKGAAGFHPPLPGGEGSGLASSPLPSMFNWWFFIIPTVGGLISGWLVYTWAPEAEGHGTDGVIKAFHQERGKIRARVPIIKTIASAITIGTGGSAGREGPIAQIGAGFGSIFASKLKLTDQDRRTMVVSGMAAGIGSIFRSPIGRPLRGRVPLQRRHGNRRTGPCNHCIDHRLHGLRFRVWLEYYFYHRRLRFSKSAGAGFLWGVRFALCPCGDFLCQDFLRLS